MLKLLALTAVIVLLEGCSNRQVYESIQINRMHNCIPKIEPLRDLCLEQYKMTYEEYERLRQEALHGEDPNIAQTKPLR